MIRLAIAATVTAALSATGLAAAAGSADVFTYRSTLTAKAEVPKPKAPTGAGGLFTAKVAKKRYRIYEVPISYSGRDYEEGKKIGWRDGVQAIWTIIKYRFTD